MTPRGRDVPAGHRGGTGLALVIAVLLALIPALVAPVAAAGTVTFGDPSATVVFAKGITFSQPITATGVEAKYAEILITRPDSVGPDVHTIAQVGNITSSTFEYSLREENEHLYPNTKFSARWRVIDAAGEVHLGPLTSVTYADTRFAWKSATGKLVRVHWYQGSEEFGQRALAIGEAGVAKAEELFGVTETQPVDFFVYADLQAFYGALGPGTRENVGGEALPEIRTLFALITPDQINESWVGVVIPHELTHLVFDTAVHNPYHFPPRWLNEGLAVYLSQGLDASDRGLVSTAARRGDIIPLNGLLAQFPTQRDKFALAYAESVSALDFMVRQYGRPAVVKLVQSYAAGVTDDEAFKGALGVDAAAFNDAWFNDIGARAALAQGPLPDPAGPLPSGWTSSPVPAPSAAVPSPAAPSGSPGPSPGATATPGARSPGASAVVLPTFAPASPPPGASSAVGGPSAVAVAPSPVAPTPGVIADQPAPARASNIGLAFLFGAIALVLAAVGIGLLAVRRRSPELR